MTQNNPHNEMPKDTVEETWIQKFDRIFGFKENGDKYFTTDYIENGLKQFIQREIDTAYNKGVEALRDSIEKEKWTTYEERIKVFSYDDVQEHTERLLKEVSL